MHWLIIIPYYFFAAITLLALMMVLCRLLRIKVGINVLVGIAIVGSLAGIIAPLALDIIDLHELKAWPMLVIALVSFVLAAIDAALVRALPLPLDKDLQEL